MLSKTGRIGTFYKGGGYIYELSDYLGNVRATVSKNAGGLAQLESFADYYPGGMELPGRSQINSPKYKHGYQGQFAEKDEETGLNQFQLRLYDSRINRFLSTDPYGQFHSPYMAMGNNWVSSVDPDGGASYWIPDGDGNLIAESGDNVFTLMDYLDIGYTEASTLFSGYGNWDGGALGGAIGGISGHTLTLNNVYTQSILNSTSDYTLDNALAGTSVTGATMEDYYNCWGSACAGSQGKKIEVGVGIDLGSTFDANLTRDYTAGSLSSPQFGKTVVRFANGSNSVQHGAVYYGTSKNGTVYVYTKNGWNLKPEVMKLSRVSNSSILKYGTVKGIQSGHTGYYNPN